MSYHNMVSLLEWGAFFLNSSIILVSDIGENTALSIFFMRKWELLLSRIPCIFTYRLKQLFHRKTNNQQSLHGVYL